MQERGWQVSWLGTRHGMEQAIVPGKGIEMESIDFAGMRGKGLLKAITGGIKMVAAYVTCRAIMKRRNPDLVLGMGGYVTVPGGMAAKMKGIPLVLVNADAALLLSNKALAPYAARVLFGFPADFGAAAGKALVTGNPVRPAIINTTHQQGIDALALDADRLTLSILGGSLGSTAVNEAMTGALRQLAQEAWFRDRWQVVHVVGPQRGGGFTPEEAKSLGVPYHAYPFLDNIHDVLAASDAIVSRAVGTFLAEIAARGVPMILIPWSGAANNHQWHNAQPFAEAGAAVVISDDDLSADRVLTALNAILPDPARRTAMAAACRKLGHPEAASRIVDLVEELAGRK
jgi:UDP-N-acetylglucosamine--N-acetylmuramyl-(pentapeptide) pyrophosphoryl-undecaprenol N-acetylglucosamine transferase